MRRYLPDFLYELIQLAAIPFDALRSTPDGILTLRVLKAERSGELLCDPVWDEELLAMVLIDTFHLIVSYMYNRDSVDNDALFHKIKSIGSEPHRTAAMTLAQKLRQEGRTEGRQEGRTEGNLAGSRQSVIEALEVRFGSIPEASAIPSKRSPIRRNCACSTESPLLLIPSTHFRYRSDRLGHTGQRENSSFRVPLCVNRA